MARPKKADPASVASVTLTIRLTADERATLDRLVDRARASLMEQGGDTTASTYVRSLIRREARRLEASEQEREAASDLPAEAREWFAKAKRAGVKQLALAKRAGVDPSRVSRWATGKATLTDEQLKALIDAAKATVGEKTE